MNPNEALQAAKDALDKAIEQKKQNQELLRSIGPAIIEILKPILEQLAQNAKLTKEEIIQAISSVKIQVPEIASPIIPEIKVPNIKVPAPEVIVNFDSSKIQLPEIKIPVIKIPKPEITVNVPPVKIPKLEWPEEEMPIKGWVQLMGVNLQHPLPVQLRDKDGNPVVFGGGVAIGGGGGGGGNSVIINDTNHPVPTTGFLTQVSGAIDSINVVQLGGNSVSLSSGDVEAGTQRIVSARSANATTAAVSVGADASTQIVPTNLSRKSVVFVHASSSNLYLSTGTALSTAAFPIVGNQIYGFDDYTGPVNGIAEEQAGTISVRYFEIV